MKSSKKSAYSMVISLFALIVATSSLCLNYRTSIPIIEVTEVTEYSVEGQFFSESSNRLHLFAYKRIFISNRGGRTVTLIGITPTKELLGLGTGVFTIRNNKIMPIPFRIALPKITLTKIKKNFDLIDSLHYVEIESLSLINKVIKPGEHLDINIALLIDAYDDESVPIGDYALIDWKLDFSDGTKYRLLSSFDIP